MVKGVVAKKVGMDVKRWDVRWMVCFYLKHLDGVLLFETFGWCAFI